MDHRCDQRRRGVLVSHAPSDANCLSCGLPRSQSQTSAGPPDAPSQTGCASRVRASHAEGAVEHLTRRVRPRPPRPVDSVRQPWQGRKQAQVAQLGYAISTSAMLPTAPTTAASTPKGSRRRGACGGMPCKRAALEGARHHGQQHPPSMTATAHISPLLQQHKLCEWPRALIM